MVENAYPSLRNKKKWITINNQPMKSYLKILKEHDPLSADERMKLIESSSKLVGPGVFYSTLIVIAFFYVFTNGDGRKIIQSISDKIIYTDSRCVLAITLTPV
jgi:Cu(I)/Ag(I) efflux system membrane protein CusA/SilA